MLSSKSSASLSSTGQPAAKANAHSVDFAQGDYPCLRYEEPDQGRQRLWRVPVEAIRATCRAQSSGCVRGARTKQRGTPPRVYFAEEAPGFSKASDVRAGLGSKMRGLRRTFRPPLSLQRTCCFQRYHTQRRASASHDGKFRLNEAVAKVVNFATKLGSHF